MKKVFSIVAVALVAASFVACGPSAEEKKALEERAKQIQDSINAAIEASLQATTPTETPDSLKAAETTTAPAVEATPEVKK